jgi:hypothetical protein
LTLAVAGALAVTLSACTPTAATVTPAATPVATAKPVFASDAEALAAAEKAYAGYSAASDAVARDGGTNPARISDWVTMDWLAEEVSAASEFALSGHHLSGRTTYSSFALQSVGQNPLGEAVVGAYICLDVSGAKVLDTHNVDVTPPSRPNVIPIEVQFTSRAAASSTLVLSKSDPWPGTNFCV